MTSIDHRILIPAPGPDVWEYINNIENNPVWQEDCENITFLSQKRSGVGTRWRQRSSGRQEAVYEITTWYNGLGYEYVLIDGAPFKSAQGRIRLQEIAEGTIIQWSLTYELGGGLLGDLRNALSTERRQEKMVVNSLKTLWKEAKRLGSLEGYVPRSVMRDGPPAEPLRSASSTVAEDKAISTTTEPTSASDSPIEFEEPPVSDDDTRPRPAVATADTLPEPVTAPVEDEHARFAPPADMSRAAPSPAPTEGPTETSPEPQAEETVTPEPVETSESTPAMPEPVQLSSEEPASALSEPDQSGDSAPSTPLETFEPQVPAGTDTSEVSIWEVFGIPSPTDTQKMRAIQAAEEAEAEYNEEAEAALKIVEAPTLEPETTSSPIEEVAPTPEDSTKLRRGFRARARRNIIQVRRPGK